MFSKVILVLLGIVTSALCWLGKSKDPACPELKVIDTIDIEKFMGEWYQYGSFGKLFIHGLDKCVVSNYTLSDDKTTICMNNKRQVIKTNTELNSVWKAKINNPNNPDGHFTVNIDLPVIGHRTLNMFVLGVDYDHFAVLYVCGKVKFIKFRAAYIFLRKQNYLKEELNSILAAVNPILEANTLSQGMFSLTQQTDCGHPISLVKTAISLFTNKTLGEDTYTGTEDVGLSEPKPNESTDTTAEGPGTTEN